MSEERPADSQSLENVPTDILPVDENGGVIGEDLSSILNEVASEFVYYFDGSGGCDLCQSYTGYYLDELPPRPHPFCNCPVIVLAKSGGSGGIVLNQYAPPCWDVYEQIQWPSYSYPHTIQRGPAFNYGRYPLPSGGTASMQLTNTLSPALESAALQAGWNPPFPGVMSYSFDIPARCSVTWEEEVTRVHVDISAVKMELCSGGGKRNPRPVSGVFEINISAVVGSKTFKKLY